ncbi:MAG: YggT family protein [Desulfarculus sp.]|nr:YggT family protein [Desulfarculus sp.]
MILLFNLLRFVDWLLDIYTWVIIAAAVVTWVNPDPGNPIVRFLRGVTEPVFHRIRRLIPTNFGGLDIAPLLLILVIYFVQRVLIGSLFSLFKTI